ANMVLFETGVAPVSVFDKDGIAKDDIYFVYQFWPEDNRYTRQICTDFGTGAAFSVYEPGWMKNIIAMARAGTLPRGSKLNLYFGADNLGAMAPPIPEALELYLKMMEGLDLKWAVSCPGRDGSVMDTPLARMALERGGSLRVGLEDDTTGPSNVEQIERAKKLVYHFRRRGLKDSRKGQAYKVSAHDHWFWIDLADQKSKALLEALNRLFYSQLGATKPGDPILALPLGPRP
ncbi:MAG: 3-keto-5-aminohexanoate cleavage protein, partial [Deltaproteobacteria bacterium]|nr:3-keto-5-aminohexanoate cleavage protein [Deltaproteobacteria bacterium]